MMRLLRPTVSLVFALGLIGFAVGTAPPEGYAQGAGRLNKVIEALEDGRAAVANQEWRFVDMEHSPFSGQLVQEVLAEMDQDRGSDGRMRLTPLVRIPQDGDEDFKWAVNRFLTLEGLASFCRMLIRRKKLFAWWKRCATRHWMIQRTRNRAESGAGDQAVPCVCGIWAPTSITGVQTSGRSIPRVSYLRLR